MDIKVKNLYLRISPLKMRPILYGLRGQNAEKARISLNFVNKKGAKMIAALIKSALATAKENDLDLNSLSIKSIYCNEGPRLKRRQIKARGRSDAILKRMSHLCLTISDMQGDIKKEGKKEIKEISPTSEKNINKENLKPKAAGKKKSVSNSDKA